MTCFCVFASIFAFYLIFEFLGTDQGSGQSHKSLTWIFFQHLSIPVCPPRFLQFPRGFFGGTGDGVMIDTVIAVFPGRKTVGVRIGMRLYIKRPMVLL